MSRYAKRAYLMAACQKQRICNHSGQAPTQCMYQGVVCGAPCIIVDAFTGGDVHTYLSRCFVFVDGRLRRLPVESWAREAVQTPGQVWCPHHVDAKTSSLTP